MTYRSILTLPALGVTRDLNRILDDVIGAPVARTWQPDVDVRETAEALIIEADLPGLAPADIEVKAEQHVLSISGSRTRARATSGQERLTLTERAWGTFRRSFQLPREVDAARIEASFANGVLMLRIPKTPAARPRTIEVKPAVQTS